MEAVKKKKAPYILGVRQVGKTYYYELTLREIEYYD